jgi:pimeloyl-ACP methyl ester carboxylesterase
MRHFLILLSAISLSSIIAAEIPIKIQPAQVISKFDQTAQLIRFQSASGNAPRPLLVALHTWSQSGKSGGKNYAELCRKKNWHMVYPHFRGPNWHPDACGSDLVISDIEDAVAYMCKNFNVDTSRIYLLGGSGGGHCALLMAGRRPDLFSAVSAWCPISDIARWHKECRARKRRYNRDIEKSCGGDPELSPEAKFQAQLRSPLTWLPNAAGKTIIDISTGIHDGHSGSVPVGHAIRAYNILADEADRISDADIEFIEKNRRVPEHLAAKNSDPAYGKHTVYLRKVSSCVRLTLFEGGHNIFPEISGEFLERQVRGQKPDFANGKALDNRMDELAK